MNSLINGFAFFFRTAYQNRRSFLMLTLALSLSFGTTSCKGRKEAAATADAEALRARQIEQAKKDLIALLSEDNNKSLDEKEAELTAIKQLGLEDPEVSRLIAQVEEKLSADRERERLAKEEEAQKAQDAVILQAKQRALNSAFGQIANAYNEASANKIINETLELFSNDDVPVLTIIHMNSEGATYDRPTTIRLYLEYLKDQRKVNEQVYKATMADNGKISELELIKK